jgi:hypothetical protein
VELRPFAAGIDADAPDDSAASSVDSDAALLLRCDRCAAYGYAGIDAPLGAAGSAGAAGAPAPCASALWTCAVCGAAHADDGTSPASSSARLNSARAASTRGAGGRREHAARWGVSGGDSSASWTGSWIDVPLHAASGMCGVQDADVLTMGARQSWCAAARTRARPSCACAQW